MKNKEERINGKGEERGEGSGAGFTHLVLLPLPTQEGLLLELVVVGPVVGLHLPGKC